MKSRLYLLGGLVLATLAFGCNIFSPFYSEGNSDDPQALLEDAQAALREGRAQEALKILDKAKAKDSNNPNIRYYHAVATVRAHDLDFNTFIDMLEEAIPGEGGLAKGIRPGSKTSGLIKLFDFTEAELAEIAQVFYNVSEDLRPVVEGLRRGTISPEDFAYIDDAYLSYGVASLVSGFIFMLDQDHALPFQLDQRISINRIEDTYEVFVEDPKQTAQQIEAEIRTLINGQYDLLEEGLVSLWYYYYVSTFGELPRNAPPLPPAGYGRIRDTASGEFFKVVHSGLSALYDYAYGG